MYLGHYQTMKLSFEQICKGEQPWIPLGNFMNDWYAYHFEERERLIVDPLPDIYAEEFQQWAAFCAASVRWFCSTYEVPCPSWIDHPCYVLSKPWYMDAPRSLWQEERRETAPEFAQHNIYCGNRVYINKYERDEQNLPLRAHPVELQERRARVRIADARLKREYARLEEIYKKYVPLRHALQASKDNLRQIAQ